MLCPVFETTRRIGDLTAAGQYPPAGGYWLLRNNDRLIP
jgi:hypothetical protein